MIYTIEHVTQVEYEGTVRTARFNLRLEPVAWPNQTVTDYALSIDPAPSHMAARPSAELVNVARVVIPREFDTLTVKSRFVAVIEEPMPELLTQDLSIAQLRRAATDAASLTASSPVRYIFRSPLLPPVPEIAGWAEPLLRPDASAFDSALAICRKIHAEFAYDAKATEADTPVARAFTLRRGVCQDFTHIMIAALRSVGLPAAYISGYLRTDPPRGKPRLVGADAMHAWVGLWCGPHRGWVGLDPTNGVVAGSGHIVVAMGRDYADVAPIDGVVVGGGAQHLTTSVDVVS